MTFRPTQTQRSVLLALKFMPFGDVMPGFQPIDTMCVNSISALYADVEDITVEIFTDSCEANLLRRFWRSIRPGDRVFAANVEAGLSRLRLRSWTLDVLPSPEIDLRAVYGIETWDTGKMWASGYVPYPLHTRQPDSEIKVEIPFDEAFDEWTVHSRD